MSEYETREQRAALEAELAELPLVEAERDEDASIVVSVRIKGSEVDELRAAAEQAGVKLSRFIREAALIRARSGKASIAATVEHLARDVEQLRRQLAS